MGWVEALIGTIGIIAVALIQKDRSEGRERRAADKQEHDALVEKVDALGKNLGRSIDRVEGNLGENLLRVQIELSSVHDKLDQHIHDHAVGALVDAPTPRRRKRQSA